MVIPKVSVPGRFRELLLLMGVSMMAIVPGALAVVNYKCYYPGNPNPSGSNLTCVDGNCTGITWPKDAEWRVACSTESPTDYTGPANKQEVQLVGDTNCPALYFAKQKSGGADYLFFRMRTAWSSAVDCSTVSGQSTFKDSHWIFLKRSGASFLEAAFAWDSANATNWFQHGLEMQIPSSSATANTTWGNLTDDDWDCRDDVTKGGGCATQSCTGVKWPSDIDGGNCTSGKYTARGEGFVRTVDGVVCNGTTYTFVDFAVKCSFFTRTNTIYSVGHFTGANARFDQLPDFCNSQLYIQAGAGQNSNDHTAMQNQSNADVDCGDNMTTTIGSGWPPNPTYASMSGFKAYRGPGGVLLGWVTTSEVGTAGFNLYRHDRSTGERKQINGNLIPALLETPQGGKYVVADPDAGLDDNLTYTLEEIEMGGGSRVYGPFTVMAEGPLDDTQADATMLEVTGYSRTPKPYTRPQAAERIQAAVSTAAATGSEMKIGVRQARLYRIDAGDIAAKLGLSVAKVRALITSNGFDLRNQGKQVAMMAASDSRALYFYGEGIESIYANTNVYWLKQGKGKAMANVRVAAGNQKTPGAVFTDNLHVEQDTFPAPALFHDPETDFWFWKYLAAGDPANSSRTFDIQPDGATGAGQLTINLQGLTASGSVNEHHAVVYLNNSPVGQIIWAGAAPHNATFPVKLLNGKNEVEVMALLDQGIPYSVFAVDSFDLAYERQYQAVGDRLLLRGDKNKEVLVQGFSNSEIWVFDLADPRAPRMVSNATTGGVSGASWVRFRPTAADRLYLAVTPAAAASPAWTLASSPGTVKQKSLSASNYLIITAPQLSGPAAALASYRAGRGLKPLVVTTEQIYDQVSYGIATPHAIHDFVKKAAASSGNKLRFVVFLGEGSFDYRNYEGFGDSLVPPLMVDTPWGLAPSDAALVDVLGNDGLADLAFGRIPAIDEGQVKDYLNKLTIYEASSGAWAERVLLVSDKPDETNDFSNNNNNAALALPAWLTHEKIYLADMSFDEAHQQLLEDLHEGALVMNYFGHAGVTGLTQQGLLTLDDVPALDNNKNLPVFAAMTCVVGQFGIPGFDALGEALVKRSDGGGIAVWAPTGLALDGESSVLNLKFWNAVSEGAVHSLGEAIAAGNKDYAQTGGLPFILRIYTLLGDPALELKH